MKIKTKSLPQALLQIIQDKGTEAPFTGLYQNFTNPGTYLCRQCGLAAFRAESQFHSGCGWPSFDQEIPGAVKQVKDADGRRIEILCERCGAHFGHVFQGEGFTPKNTRHCVNAASLDFVENTNVLDAEEGIFAAGCFWGVEYYFKKLPGVLKTEVGYIGGSTENPTYENVCNGNSGYIEAIRVIFDPSIISYETLAKYFFEIHDPTQKNGQGPDLGEQYLSEIFYYDDEQKNTAENLIHTLKKMNYDVATTLRPVNPFWPAEEYHQDYYSKNQKAPYCHTYTKRFA
jgi:peptide methionine sulfoxide reductase msrA/msrB